MPLQISKRRYDKPKRSALQAKRRSRLHLTVLAPRRATLEAKIDKHQQHDEEQHCGRQDVDLGWNALPRCAVNEKREGDRLTSIEVADDKIID